MLTSQTPGNWAAGRVWPAGQSAGPVLAQDSKRDLPATRGWLRAKGLRNPADLGSNPGCVSLGQTVSL